MWYYQDKMIQVGRGWTDSKGVKHPRTWANWSEDRKKEMGMIFKAPAAKPVFDSQFYTAPNVAKPLVDTPMVDGDNKPVLDMDGNPMVQQGLKTEALSRVKSQAAALLAPTDWYVTRFAEMGYDPETGTVDEVAVIPDDVKAFRAAVREASNTIETAITAAANLQAFMNLYKAPVDAQGNPTGPAPINAWPQS